MFVSSEVSNIRGKDTIFNLYTISCLEDIKQKTEQWLSIEKFLKWKVDNIHLHHDALLHASPLKCHQTSFKTSH